MLHRVWMTALVVLATSGCPAPSQTISTPPPAHPTSSQAAASASCLPQRHVDLVEYLRQQPFAARDGGPFVSVSRGSPRWMAAYNAALSWQLGDCGSFALFADQMGYQAEEVIDTVTGSHHFVLSERASRYNGLFVLRAPSELPQARPLTLTVPHRGLDLTDDRALLLYRELGALGLLQNTAHPCNLATCSGCSTTGGGACGGCRRASDEASSVDHLMFALLSGMDAMNKAVRVELHGTPSDTTPPGCPSWIHLSSGSTRKSDSPPSPPAHRLSLAPVNEALPAARLWRALERTLQPRCVCFRPYETDCSGPDVDSVFARLINHPASADAFDACSTAVTAESGRFLRIDTAKLPLEPLIAGLSEAVPLPIQSTISTSRQ